jgi:NTE family protein
MTTSSEPSNAVSASSPVSLIETDPQDTSAHLEPGIALCLSGGGYRAMLFHLGTLLRLNEVGYLPKLNRISSVSGGSITAGVLGLSWARLAFDQTGVATNFDTLVVEPIRKLGSVTIDAESIVGGILLPGTIADKVADEYRKYLFGQATLQDLPSDPPRFVFNATNVQSGALWRFSKPYMADYRVGMIKNPTVELAVAVGASSAFPPVLSPVELRLEESDYVPGSGLDLHREPFTTQVILTDGGVYDNLGLETAWKRYQTILVSDAGGQMSAEEEPKRDWVRHARRILDLVDNQVRSLRKRQVIDSFSSTRKGAYWGIRTDILRYPIGDALTCPYDKTIKLANTPTRLKRLDAGTQERIINWGYAVCDAAMRSHVDQSLSRPQGFIYPASGVG